jgi:Chaperone of endosialidase
MKISFLGRGALVTAALVLALLSPVKTFAASSVDDSSVAALQQEIIQLRAENAALRKIVEQRKSGASSQAVRAGMITPPPEKAMAKATITQATPPVASGYIEAYTGGAWSEDSIANPFLMLGSEKYNGWTLGVAGRGNWWLTPNVSAQFDAQADGTQYKVPSDQLPSFLSANFSTLSYLIGGHVNWRDPRIGLLGLFGGIGDAGGNSATVAIDNSGVRHGTIGLEGQYYVNALTLYAQGGYDSTMINGNATFFSQLHAWYLRGTGRYFLRPNVMVEGTAQYASGAADYSSLLGIPNADFNTWLWRVRAEWRPGVAPVSVFATYEGSRTSYGNNVAFGTTSERMSDNRVMAGLRLYMGQDTLLANDRTGATLDIIDPLGAATSPLMILPVGQAFIVSDERLKRDIVLLGRRDDGLGIYRYRYLWSETVYVGVMAQEVALIHPEAVLHGLDGYLRVDYYRIGLHLMTLPEWDALSKTHTL